jgi:hypothetical protein
MLTHEPSPAWEEWTNSTLKPSGTRTAEAGVASRCIITAPQGIEVFEVDPSTDARPHSRNANPGRSQPPGASSLARHWSELTMRSVVPSA